MIRRLRDRDEAGMADLLLHFGPLMRYIIAPILPNPQDREDCLSEVTLRIWEKIDQFDPRRGKPTAVQRFFPKTPRPRPSPRKRRCCKKNGRRPCKPL